MIFRELIGGTAPNVNTEKVKNIDVYCEKILNVLKNDAETFNKLKDSIKVFDDTKEEWINKLNKDKFGIKDVKDFTELLLKNMKKEASYKAVFIDDNEYTYSGDIVKILKDSFGKRYGFISYEPRDIFFHQNQSKSLDLSDDSIIGRRVCFKITKNHSGNVVATDVKLE